MAGKLPVFATVKASYGYLRRYGLRMLPYLIALVVIMGAIIAGAFVMGIGAAVLGVVTPNDPGHKQLFTAVTGLLSGSIMLLVFIPVQNSIQRLVAQGSEARVGLRYGSEEWRTLFVLLKLIGVIAAVLLLIAIPFGVITALTPGLSAGKNAHPVMVVYMLVAFICFIVLAIRFYPMMPAAAVGDRVSFREAMALTKGSFWRLIGVGICVVLPFVMLERIARHFLGEGVVGAFATFPISVLSLFLQSASYALVYQHLKSVRETTQMPPSLDDGVLPDPVI